MPLIEWQDLNLKNNQTVNFTFTILATITFQE